MNDNSESSWKTHIDLWLLLVIIEYLSGKDGHIIHIRSKNQCKNVQAMQNSPFVSIANCIIVLFPTIYSVSNNKVLSEWFSSQNRK